MSDEKGRAGRVTTGRIKVHPDGFAFVVPDDKSEDIHVSGRARGAALDADKVEVDWWVGARGLEGRVTRVLERGRGKLTGTIRRSGRGARFTPDDARIASAVGLRGDAAGARDGQCVVARILRYPSHPEDNLEVEVMRVLGDPDDPRTEIEKILACADIEEAFPPEVERETAAVPTEVQANELHDRADLRHVRFTTIDPETARDFDDAVAHEPLPDGGHRVWVAVADVSHYVREGSALDAEARRRGVSVYLPNRAIPMLPEPLSAHMCSLVPEQDRMAMVVRIDMDRNAVVRATDFCAAVIRSHARFDYPGVAAALAGDLRGPRAKYEPFLASLRALDDLTQITRKRRFERGALDLDLPEPVVVLDRDDPTLVRDVRRARKDPGERRAYAMIEELMLAANEAVGESFAKSGEDVVWRVHAPPKDEKLEAFAELAEHYGISFDRELVKTPRGLADLLERCRNHPAAKPLAFQLLRSLKQATYDVANVGHFGLASSAYIHFTSPIRRYPDVLAHRLLKHRLARMGKPAGGFSPTPRPATLSELPGQAAESSFNERRAMEAEREVLDLYRAYFMRDRIGDVLQGTVTGVTSFGLFVAIDEPFVEGLIRTEELGPGRFEFDPQSMRLLAGRSGRSFGLGDAVTVELLSVSVPRRRIELRLKGRGASAEDAQPSEQAAEGSTRSGRSGERQRSIDNAYGREAPRPGQLSARGPRRGEDRGGGTAVRSKTRNAEEPGRDRRRDDQAPGTGHGPGRKRRDRKRGRLGVHVSEGLPVGPRRATSGSTKRGPGGGHGDGSHKGHRKGGGPTTHAKATRGGKAGGRRGRGPSR